MLVLSRKSNERIVINDNITIKVIAVRGNTVRLGIEAPDSVAVLRGEIATKGDPAAPQPQIHLVNYASDTAAGLEGHQVSDCQLPG